MKMSERKCKDCKQVLILGQNWSEYDSNHSRYWCKDCKNKYNTWYRNKTKPPDLGIKKIRRITNYSKSIPESDKVEEFREYIADPRNLNRKGFPRVSKIFKINSIDTPEKGFTTAEMSAALYPEECDDNGIPSQRSKNSVRGYLKRVTEKYQGNLEIYSTPCVIKGKHEWRWHITKRMKDTKEQTSAMMKISRGIELNAKRREKNQMKTEVERMRKVDLLDEFFSDGFVE
jgi:hypothetical protein